VRLFDVATAKEKVSISIGEKDAQGIGYLAFSPDGKLLVGQVRGDPRKAGLHWLKFWDPATGHETASVEGEKQDLFLLMTFSPDGETLAVTNARSEQGKLFLFDLPSKKIVRTVNLGEKAHAGEMTNVAQPAFSPDGKWVAVPTQVLPDRPPLGLDPQDVPQPRIHLIDVSTGTLRETLVAPQSLSWSVCFSPDGKTLATGGHGKVLLWDLRRPPGGTDAGSGRE
jgi:WD40 repeat protein